MTQVLKTQFLIYCYTIILALYRKYQVSVFYVRINMKESSFVIALLSVCLGQHHGIIIQEGEGHCLAKSD